MDRKLIVGADPFPPYQYMNDQGQIIGSDCETVRNAFLNAGYEIEIIIDDWAKIETDIRHKNIDAAFQVQKTPEREKLYYFSDLLRYATTEVITNDISLQPSSLSSIDTQGLSLGAIANYAYGEPVDSINPTRKRFFDQQSTLLHAISTGNVNLGIFDQGVKQYLMQREQINNLHVLDALTFQRPLYVVFASASIRDAFNYGLQQMIQSDHSLRRRL